LRAQIRGKGGGGGLGAVPSVQKRGGGNILAEKSRILLIGKRKEDMSKEKEIKAHSPLAKKGRKKRIISWIPDPAYRETPSDPWIGRIR